MAMSDQEPIAVIGMACRFPGGSDSPSKLWDLIKAPRDLSQRVPVERFDTTGFYHKNGSHHGASDATNAYFLDEDVTRFDNSFFNIQPAEAEAIDPQQRLVMETVYDSLCAGGQAIENLRGSNTAVYVGMMCDDWSQIVNRDWDFMPTYAATGESRAIISNRVSYFFDWHGPSMTIDTACSSSLVAVHQGVTALRNGECPVAIAAGANLIIAPGMFIAESNLHMLSPTGSSKMWDAAADGYARGEGIAAIVMKPLSAAIRDGDHIDCIIRGTSVNQDGKTAGLTMPSNIAQTQLIRDTYARAGLDINDPRDRPQFFHAHGTGTPAGDPQEAEAISRAFFKDSQTKAEKLYVGSIKTVIGHTEGSAGLASLIGSVMAMQHGTIPPNLHFNKLSDRVAPFFTHLRIPTCATPWPETDPGQPRRVSVNSFGFGGTNAHAIIEYHPDLQARRQVPPTKEVSFTPLTVSAASSASLKASLRVLKDFMSDDPTVSLRDIAFTLQTRRSTLPFRKAIVACDRESAIKRIESVLNGNNDDGLKTRSIDVSQPKLLGVFTGQGAQWPRMGARLVESSQFAAQRVAQLQRALGTLPLGDRPDWTLMSQLTAPAKSSRLSEAAIAQPLCTAVQIVLVDLLRAAGIKLDGVVGHSSGEIAAAYAAGFLTAENAIRVAYYRGLYAKFAKLGGAGAMMAVGTSYEDAQDFCDLDDFRGRIQVAARNSSTSITLSGDEDVIDEAIFIFQDEGKFARKLRVDTAYHSTHMLPCAEPYLAGLARVGYQAQAGNGTVWFSSVFQGRIMTEGDVNNAQYWVDNMTNAVLFEPAILEAIRELGSFDMAIELGPHPALKGPALDTIEEIMRKKIPYTGLLARGKDDVDELSSALGYLWTHLGANSLDFNSFETLISGHVSSSRQLVSNLPTYQFDHSRSFYSLTRYSGGYRHITTLPHPLLGRRLVETETAGQISWRNILKPTENGWLHGHGLQGQSVFPAMGYISLAVEAVAAAASDRHLGLIKLQDVVIGRALAFTDDNTGVETKITLDITDFDQQKLSARITCHSGLPFDSSAPLGLNFSAQIVAEFHRSEMSTLPSSRQSQINLVKADPERLYSQFVKLGYNYNSPFTGVRAIQRKMGWATGEIEDESGDGFEDNLLVHPGWLDSAIQTGFVAHSHPHDNRLFTLCVPTAIQSVVINPYFCDTSVTRNRKLDFQTTASEIAEGHIMVDIDIFTDNQSHPFVQFEAVELQPFAAATARDDAVLFTRHSYYPALPNASLALSEEEKAALLHHSSVYAAAERVAFYYLRRLTESVSKEERAAALPHYQYLLDFADRIVKKVSQGTMGNSMSSAILKDSPAYIRSLVSKFYEDDFMKLLQQAVEHLDEEIRAGGDMLEHLTQNDLAAKLHDYSPFPSGSISANSTYARVCKQITNRFPRSHILEVGHDSILGSTSVLLSEIGDAFQTYTYSSNSTKGIERVQSQFQEMGDRFSTVIYDINQPASEQGLEDGTYDIILLSSSIHSVNNLEESVASIRSLLRPGGYLVMLAPNTNQSISLNAILGSLPEWWVGAQNGDALRSEGPSLSLSDWNSLTLRNGFSGIDTHTFPGNGDEQMFSFFSVLVTQAVDEHINKLRAPLLFSGGQLKTEPLFIVGGKSVDNAQMVEELRDLLSTRYETVITIPSMLDLTAQHLGAGCSVLSLTELDEQFLEIRTEAKLDSLKALWQNASNVLWVTRCARDERPFSSIMLGLCRVARLEYPAVNLRLLDFDLSTKITPNILADAFLRLDIEKQLKKGDTDIFWSSEPEYYFQQGQLFIPRLLAHNPANDRYNTYRRTLQREVDLEDVQIALEATAGGKAFELATVSPLRVLGEPEIPRATISLSTEWSTPYAFKVGDHGYYHLLVGTKIGSEEQFVAVTESAVESQTRVPLKWAVPISARNGSIAESLVLLAVDLIASSIIGSSPKHGTVVIHEADEPLRKALDNLAVREGIRFMFTTNQKQNEGQEHSFGLKPCFIHEKLPSRLVRSLLPRDVSLFVDMSESATSPCSVLLAQSIPPQVPKISGQDFIRSRAGASPDIDGQRLRSVGELLSASWQTAVNKSRASPHKSDQHASIFKLTEVSEISTNVPQVVIVDWKTKLRVQALIRPIDHCNIFRADGTYLLVGLTGEVGQSLCAWMARHGARNIVLSSRRPKISQQFLDQCAEEGATVTAVSIDITSRESLRTACGKIRETMPPIIGVANGAMMMDDALFDDMTFESIQRTMPPKIEGSIVLDEFFYETPLDFFILFTSLSNAVGNVGQSAYVMANQFMAALAAQRRNIRGVAGSDIAISSIQGLGYFEHANHLDKDHFVNMGYRNVSEHDFLTQFAEGILAGRPGDRGSSEVCTGVSPYREGAVLLGNPCFGHLLLHDAALNGGTAGRRKGAAGAERPLIRIAAAKSETEQISIIREAFIERLKRILLIPQDDTVNEKVTLVEQGVDSIMAVEVRTWFIQELGVDIPVLKILGVGSTTESLIETAHVAILKTLVNGEVSEVSGKPPKEQKEIAAEVPTPDSQLLPPVPTKPSTESVSSFTDSSSPRAISTPVSGLETPLETPLETVSGSYPDLKHAQETSRALEKQQRESWRKTIIDSSTTITQPMTYGQRRFWFLHHYIQDRTTFNVTVQFKMTGRLRIHDLTKAVVAVAQRHEALRTRFLWSSDGTETPMQSILSKPLVNLETMRINSEDQAKEELEAMHAYEWDLNEWLPLRVKLLSLSDTVHYFLIGSHHITLDGHSINILMHDINQAYNHPRQSIGELPVSSQARSFGQKQILDHKNGNFRDAIEYFRTELQSVNMDVPVELLPFARSQVRLPLDSYETHVSQIRLDKATISALKTLTRSHRSTSFHGYLATFQALLFRLLPDETTNKLVIGIADANRLDESFMGSIGNFLNVLPLTFHRASKNAQIGDAIEEARTKVYSALEHSALPFDILLDELAIPRSNTYAPVFQILMDYKLLTSEQAEMNWLGCKTSEHTWHPARGSYDIALEIVEDRDGASLNLHMQQTLYTKEATDLLLRSFANVIHTVVQEKGNQTALNNLPKWDEADITKALELGKGTDLPFEWPDTIPERLDQVIKQCPQNLAVKDGFGRAWTYHELDAEIEKIAACLRQRLPDQNKEQSVVGVFQSPSANWIASLFAILRIGAVYLPLDLKVSEARLKGYVKAAKPSAILTDNDTISKISDIGASESELAVINISTLPVEALKRSSREATAAQPDRPAYIIFTSGSTGEPKGIVVKHASFRAMMEGYVREWDIAKSGRVVLQQFAFTSDGSFKQIGSAITTGGCLVVSPADVRGDPIELTRLMLEHEVTCTIATPSEYSMWFRFALETLQKCKAWRVAWFGGERSPQSLLESFRSINNVIPDLRFLTTYGPTEATISTMKGVANVHDPQLSVPIPGRPLPNYSVYIVDEDLQPVPIGVPGQIVIAGAGVGKNEYLNRPDLTDKHFASDPFATQSSKDKGWGRMYFTGDYGRLNNTGLMTVEGRVAGDAQVKVRGFRVELAEIEAAVFRAGAGRVAESVVTLREGEGDHDGVLAAHIVLPPSESTSRTLLPTLLEQLRQALSLSLPQYMVPAIIIPIDKLPLTAHGKVDRKAVQSLELPDIKSSAASNTGLQSLTPIAQRLSNLWANVLPAHALINGPLDESSDFFRVGGNSLLLVKLQAAIRAEFGDAPRLGKLMSASYLGTMAGVIEKEVNHTDWDKEISLDAEDDEGFISSLPTINKDFSNLRVLVTGATGSLGKKLVRLLAADSRVNKIIILARLIEDRDVDSMFRDLKDKISIVIADLPQISEAEPEFSDLDVILHCAADRNFWDSYAAMKPVNVDTVKVLSKLARRNGAKLHVLSSGAVSEYDDGDSQGVVRLPDAGEGYVASKWVAERYLANFAKRYHVDVTAHRPTKANEAHMTLNHPTAPNEAEKAIVNSYLVNSTILGVRPDFTNIGGVFHLAPLDDVASAISASVLSNENDAVVDGLNIINYTGTSTIRAEVTAQHANDLLDHPENHGVRDLPRVPVLHWVGKAKRAGLFQWLFTSQDLVVTDSEGRSIISRR